MTTELEDVWARSTTIVGLSSSKCDEWWSVIVSKYSEDGRQFHNIDSLQKKFQHFNSIEKHLKDPVAVSFAMIFQ